MRWPPMLSGWSSVAARRRGAAALVSVVALVAGSILAIVPAGCGGEGTTTTAAPATTAATTAGDGTTTTTTAPVVVRSGDALFAVYCAGCHGSDGKAKFSPTVVGVDAERVKSMVTDGSGDMEGYGGRLSPEEIQAIVDYVVTLK